MRLKDKLSRLHDAGPGSRAREAPSAPPAREADGGAGTERRQRVERMRGALHQMIARGQRRLREQPERAPPTGEPAEGCALPGEVHGTEHGPIHLVERWLEPRHCHGRTPIRGTPGVAADLVAKLALDPALEAVDFRRMLLLDTETTGLAGGTGTIPFLIGMAWFEDESLRVHQLLLRRPGEEAPMLRRLAERLDAASCIVSYNGKSFDWPLVRTRFVLNRVPMPDPPPHLDLLHCARRVFKRRMDSVRLLDLEAQVLGLHREDDVDGAEIPRIYRKFIRGEPSPALPTVIEHNENDLVALAALLHVLGQRFDEVCAEDDPWDHLGYAEVAARAGDTERARTFVRAAVDGAGERACTFRACMLAAKLARRGRETDEERAALEGALAAAEGELDRAEAHLALAKLFEHRVKDPHSALAHARHTEPAETPEARTRRIERLERRRTRG